MIWRLEFDDWHEDNLHWGAPSYIDLDTDTGRTFFHARQMANMQRSGGIIDSGRPVNAILELNFFSSTDATGPSIGSFVVKVAQFIQYRESREPANWTTQPNEELVALFTSANSVLQLRRWE